jgi:hypothetical protein
MHVLVPEFNDEVWTTAAASGFREYVTNTLVADPAPAQPGCIDQIVEMAFGANP